MSPRSLRARSGLPSPLAATFLLVSMAASCTPAPPPAAADTEAEAPPPGWQWSEDRIVRTVEAVRAGRDLTPTSWPDGARVAVLLSFDVDNETVTGLRYGDATVGSLSRGEYGARVALPRVLDVLDRYDVPASFFIPAWSLRLSPDMGDQIGESGRHEFGVHGWIHELNVSLEREDERRLLQQAVDYLTEATGERPVGYRAPSWNFSENTLDLIREIGFLYDSSLMADDRPYEILQAGEATGVVELPVEWILDDAPLLNPLGDSYVSPDELLEVWKAEFDVAWEEGTMFLLTMHPHYIGHRSRIVILEELIEYIRSRPGVWWATHRDAAEFVKNQAGLAPTGPSPGGSTSPPGGGVEGTTPVRPAAHSGWPGTGRREVGPLRLIPPALSATPPAPARGTAG